MTLAGSAFWSIAMLCLDTTWEKSFGKSFAPCCTEYDMVQKLNFHFDLQKIRAETDFLLNTVDLAQREVKQILLTCPEGSKDPDFYGTGKIYDSAHKKYTIPQTSFRTFNPRLRGSYLENLWRNFPFPVGRVRLMMLTQKHSYSLHRDAEPRFHIAVHTHPDCYLIYRNSPQWYHVPADGHLYRVESDHPHSAINCSDTLRVHLVFDSLEPYS